MGRNGHDAFASGTAPEGAGALGATRARSRRPRLFGAAVMIMLGALVAGATSLGAASAAAPTPHAAAALPKPGQWIVLSTATTVSPGGNPTVWLGPDNRAWILWHRSAGTLQTYELAIIGKDGGISTKPADIFTGAHWGSLSQQPVFVSNGSTPMLVFSGGRGSVGPYSQGCVVGAVPASPSWKLETWSLSANCLNPISAAAVGKKGVLSAIWPGYGSSHEALYRVGVSPTIPATGLDGKINTTGATGPAGEAADDAGNGDFYGGWAQFFSSPSKDDGIYVKNLSTNGPVIKAPGTGTNSSNTAGFSALSMASSNTHPGVFMAYCSNASPCKVQFWKIGSKTALTPPQSADPYTEAVSAGPDGRMWIAWYNESNSKVYVVRTNKADNRLGPVQVYSTPCFEHGFVSLSSGSWGRLDIALVCYPNTGPASAVLATQSIVPLSVSPGKVTIKNTSSNAVTFKVTDVGDGVPGAVVKVDGHTAKTSTTGTATISFPKGSKTGTFTVTVTALNYVTAHAKIAIVK